MAKKPEIPKGEINRVSAALEELGKQSDRGAAIIGAAIVEDVLTECLQLRLILNNTLKERLFSYEKNGPLSNFSAKIDVAYSVGLVTASVRNNLHLIRRIRNRFAHKVEAKEFSDADIAASCATLDLSFQPREKSPRRRFMSACLDVITIFGITRHVAGIRLKHFSYDPEIQKLLANFMKTLHQHLEESEKQKP